MFAGQAWQQGVNNNLTYQQPAPVKRHIPIDVHRMGVHLISKM